MHDAGAALRGVAADMGAGQAKVFAQKLHQQGSGIDIGGDGFAVHRHRNGSSCHSSPVNRSFCCHATAEQRALDSKAGYRHLALWNNYKSEHWPRQRSRDASRTSRNASSRDKRNGPRPFLIAVFWLQNRNIGSSSGRSMRLPDDGRSIMLTRLIALPAATVLAASLLVNPTPAACRKQDRLCHRRHRRRRHHRRRDRERQSSLLRAGLRAGAWLLRAGAGLCRAPAAAMRSAIACSASAHPTANTGTYVGYDGMERPCP